MLRETNIPIIFLKFEELLQHPKESLTKVFMLLLNKNDLSGTVIENRIHEVLQLGHGATQVYPMKKKSEKYKKTESFYLSNLQIISSTIATLCI